MVPFKVNMKLLQLSALLLASLALTACTTAPIVDSNLGGGGVSSASTETAGVFKPYTRPPNRLFGLMQEQGSLDAVPDVAPMIDYQQQRMRTRSLLKLAPSWESLGPDSNLGRIIDIAFHPTNANILYVASPGGGVYKSVDGGVSFTKLTALPYQPVNSIAIDPLNPNTVYFATGHYSGSGSDLLSMGVYKSIDAGATMTLLASTVPTTAATDWIRVTRVVAHPTVANRVFAGTFAGFLVSADGGATWSKVSNVPTYDVVIDPNDPTRVLCGRYDGSISYSSDMGQSFAEVRLVPPPAASTRIRTRTRFAKSTPGVVYASVDQNDGEIHKSTNGGQTWAQVSSPSHLSSQGFHTNVLWVSPTDSNHIIAGGIDLFRSTNGGVTFSQISSWQQNSTQTGANISPTTPHADHNASGNPPDYSETNQKFFVGTDGGLFQTNNAKTQGIIGWTKNGGALSITQFVGGAGKRVANVDTIVGGTQDNGTILSIGNQGWQQIAGGDGGFLVVDPIDSYVFGEFQNGVVFRYGPAGRRTICAGILDADPSDCGAGAALKLNFYSPLEMDSAGRLYLGGNSLWRSVNPKDAATWTSVKAVVTGNTASTTSSNYINAVSIQQSNPDLGVVGHNDGQIFRSTNLTSTTPTWSALTTAGLPVGRMIGAILVDPEDAKRIYVGYTGYNANNMWRSDDGGMTWNNISAGLPPGSIFAISRHPLQKDRLFVGTIWGSYGSNDAGRTWPAANDGPVATRISRLFWLGNDVLVAATFGNGMFRASVPATIVTPPNTVVEYYNPVLDNYFVTADPVEQAAVDAGAAGAEWRRTGATFKAGGASQVCRFYGNGRANPAAGGIYGPNSHFYTADTAECAGLKAAQDPNAKSWFFESNDFNTTPATNRTCPLALVPVYRAYNNGFARGVDSNHRITSSLVAITEVVAKGWSNEGIVMCAPAS